MSNLAGDADVRKRMFRVRALLVFYAGALIVSGLTAVPVEWEVRTVIAVGWGDAAPGTSWWPAMHTFLSKVLTAAQDVGARYPFFFYGFDWLAFGICVLGLLFLGAVRDPVRNVLVVKFGLLCCGLVLVFAAIVPHLRGLPWFWTFVDGSFGVVGAIPLLILLRDIRQLEATSAAVGERRPAGGDEDVTR
jgi:hypothetical protein